MFSPMNWDHCKCRQREMLRQAKRDRMVRKAREVMANEARRR